MDTLQTFINEGASRNQYNSRHKIVLINTPIQEYSKSVKPDYETVAPLGIGYLGTIAKEMGYQVHLIDAEARKLSVSEIIEEVNLHQPSVLAFNIIATNMELVAKILAGVHLTESTLVVAGGPHATLVPERVLEKMPEIKMIIRGEGELAWSKLMCAFPNLRLHDVGSISFRRGDAFVHNKEEELIEDLDEIPFLDRTLFSNDPYTSGDMKEATIISSRGCNYRCIFCAVPTLCKNRVRTRSVKNVVDEIEMLNKKFDVTSIRFMDDNFTYRKERLRELSEEILRRGIEIQWRALSRLENIDEHTLKLMKRAGCYKLSFGIESANPSIQRVVRKIIDLRKLETTLSLCRKIGIRTKGFFTIGYPGETKDQIKETVEYALSSELDDMCLSIVRAFPATPLFDALIADGWTEDEALSYHQFKSVLIKEELTDGERERYDALSRKGFKFDKFVKYHVSNSRSMCAMSLDELNETIKSAYKRFYLEHPADADAAAN